MATAGRMATDFFERDSTPVNVIDSLSLGGDGASCVASRPYLHHQSKTPEQAYGHPVDIKLMPFDAVPRRTRKCVMIVVPSLAEGQDRNEPVVS